MYCGMCGKELSPNSKFCPACGAPQQPLQSQTSPQTVRSPPSPPAVPKKKNLWIPILASVLMVIVAVTVYFFAKGQNEMIDQSNGPSAKDDSQKTITLEANNEYMIISAIDISGCTWEDGYFSGEMTFISQTTQKYVDEYSDYFYRQIYFGFYDENGNLVGDEIVQNNYIYDREYVWEDWTYVSFSSKYRISEVKVLKIVCKT